MKTIHTRKLALLIILGGATLLAACSGGAPARAPGADRTENAQEHAGGNGSIGLRTATPAQVAAVAEGDTDPRRWHEITSFRGTFSFSLERDVAETNATMGGLQTVRSSRSTSGTILLQRIDDESWSGEGTMSWSVDDFIEVRDENGELVRSATAQGMGETSLNPEETLLWIDLELGTYGLAIFPAGLYEEMEVQWTEYIAGLDKSEETGPLGYLGLMDSAGIAGWFEDLPLPEAGLLLAGTLELPDGSLMTWTLEPES